MGGFDFKILDGKEAKELIKKIKKEASLGYDGKYPPTKEFKGLWYNEGTTLSLTLDEEENEVWVCMDW